MKKILLLLAGLSVMFAADIRIYLCGDGEHAAVSDDGSSATFDVFLAGQKYRSEKTGCAAAAFTNRVADLGGGVPELAI